MLRSRFRRLFISCALFIALLACWQANSVFAADRPDTPPARPVTGEGDSRQDARGNWRVDIAPDAGVDAAALVAPAQATGGPDDYGYTWGDTALNWIDATGGTDTGMSGDSYDQRVGPLPLPFAFKYYAGSYSAVYIAASGYIAFQDAPEWPTQVQTPLPAPPNNVISPYSTPLTLATKGKAGRVFYRAGDDAPNRYFVVAWNEVSYAGEDEQHTFEVVLHENGDIVYNYKTMAYNPYNGWYCGYVGMEDGDGLAGFQYSQCAQLAGNKAIRITRPQPAARVRLNPRGQGAFTQAGTGASFNVTVLNTGELGADTYAVSLASPWPAQVTHANGNPLTDTNGDGAPDTGPVAQGQSLGLRMRVQTPAFAAVADNNSATLTLKSGRNPNWQRSAVLRTAVPAPFAQVFEDYAINDVRVNFADPQNNRVSRLTPAGYIGDKAIAALPGGGHIVAWIEYGYDGAPQLLKYLLLDETGAPRAPARTLWQSDGNPQELTVAVAANGAIGLAWMQFESRWNNNVWEYRYNQYWAALDNAGNPTASPTNLTGNTQFAAWDAPFAPSYEHTHIAAAGDNRFFIAWETEMMKNDDWTVNIFYTVRDTVNQVIKPLTQYSSTDATALDRAQVPVLVGLADSNVMLGYYDYRGTQWMMLAEFTSAGGLVKGPAAVGSNDGTPEAMTQLSSGSLLAVWQQWNTATDELHYAILDRSTYAVLAGPVWLENPASLTGNAYPSLAAMPDSRAIISWSEPHWRYRPHQYYALVGANGTLLTPATPFLAARTPSDGSGPVLNTNFYGYGIAANRRFDPSSATLPDVMVTAPALNSGAPGGGAQLPIGVANQGLPAAGNVVITAQLDSALTYVSAVPAPDDVAAASAEPDARGAVLTWHAPSLAYLAQGRILLATGIPTATIGATFPVTVTVAHDGADFDDSNMTVRVEVMAAEQLFAPNVRKIDD